MAEANTCPICGVFLSEPYIKCAECINPQLNFCVQCFAKGKEYESHKNDHPYIVVRNDFSLFDPDWMASEEQKLLRALADRGFGNWAHIARDVGTKTKKECEEHYFKYYVNNPVPPLPEFPITEANSENQLMPVSCNTFCHDPPRPTAGSILFEEMAGYMPGRGDFVTEYDEFAELDIDHISFENDGDDEEENKVWNDLQMAVLRIHQARLKERARRKWIIATYGLINMQRHLEDWKRYTSLGTGVLNLMKKCMHLFTPDDLNKFLEGILLEEKLKKRIRILQDCRSAGLTRLWSIDTYLKLKKRREERKKSRSLYDEALAQMKDEKSCQQFIQKQVLKETNQGAHDLMPSAMGRKPAPPLNIFGMPGYEKLTNKEKEVCASLRLLPTSFLQYKTTLVNECRKLGSLRLANARNVVKIDVNKTRKIYDLLLEEGLISKGN